MSLETILPFLEPIAYLLTDPSVSEIMLNPDGRIFCERAGQIERVDAALTPENVEFALRRIAHMADRVISEAEPLLEVRLGDGSRVAAVCPPVTKTWTFAIRKHSQTRYTLDTLTELGTLTTKMRDSLQSSVDAQKTILISGSTGAGKTSLLGALCEALPPNDRVIVIEDTAEIKLHGNDIYQMEARPAQGETKAVTIRDLVKQALRLRPDRLIVGEVRGPESFDLLMALNSGHAGSMSTIHANTAAQALDKLGSLAAMSGDVPLQALKPMIASAIRTVVQISRQRGGNRIVTDIATVSRYNRHTDSFEFQETT